LNHCKIKQSSRSEENDKDAIKDNLCWLKLLILFAKLLQGSPDIAFHGPTMSGLASWAQDSQP